MLHFWYKLLQLVVYSVNICTSTTKYNGIDNTSSEDIDNIKYMFEEQIECAQEMNVDFVIGELFDYYNESLLATIHHLQRMQLKKQIQICNV